ncbi:helix-hairpin-helix domain-containing protein [Mangrovibacillus cuniculi]|uniref:Helix-hairpin-helix DNA-binding motif class 1 domain-containing protein n=1 Tax=Mangrovibacillus cuniculi TaxID=2593652 RepID=A0A7S8CBJ9_9BACI|nr:helix-hairpin-helix domain-containing protein [Mangrovibacillus cuniculi]QPC46951.1 hypothetical protein G8O30_08240 [Mangrovibacillus cuniculi]
MDFLVNRKWLIAVFVLLVFIVFIYLQQPPSPTMQDLLSDSDSSDLMLEENIKVAPEVDGVEEEKFVDVKGYVKNPGVYKVKENMRVKDIIELAGGFDTEAAERAINLAQKVNDGEMIYVPSVEEFMEESVEQEETENKRVSINLGTKDELVKLPTIGPKKAEAIILYREENGHFTTIEEIKNVSGIGEKTFEQLKEFIDL